MNANSENWDDFVDILEAYRKESYPHASFQNYLKYIKARDEMIKNETKKFGLWWWAV